METQAKLESLTIQDNLSASKKKNNNKKENHNQRRFSDQQIKLLESIFESDTKLEPRKKVQLATELGLQPRQVAIWFQNRRARWKSKQIEKDFKVLRANYESLASQFESLKQEKQNLLIQLQKLNDLLINSDEEKEMNNGLEGNSQKQGGSSNRATNFEGETKLSSQEGLEHQANNINNNGGELKEQGCELLNTSQQAEASSALLENWYRFDQGGLLDQSYGSSQWLNFWT
ncbi:hypothetical protein UlMin_024269 [Ulmus minor]